jgi:hypothetical protein
MAEESQAGDNSKWQLFVAIGLAILVVILFNVNQARMRRLAEGDMVELLQYTRNMRVGDRITEKDITVQPIPARGAEGLKRVLRNQQEDYNSVVRQYLSKDVRKGDFVEWSHVSGSGEDRPSHNIEETELEIGVPIESLTSPGRDMSIGDRINLVGRFPLNGKIEAVRVIENVRVLSIGGQGMSSLGTGSGVSTGSSRSKSAYRSIGLEISPEISLQLQNLRTYLVGDYVVELRNPRDQTLADTDVAGTINEKLKELTRGAPAGTRGRPDSQGR